MKRAAIVCLWLALASCASPPSPNGITVLAASSLTEVFSALGHGHHDTFDFAASSALALQIREGAPADVFASADEANMQKVASLVDTPTVFARNRLEIVVGRGNPKHVASLADLARPGLLIALCAKQVPCGSFADQAFGKAHVSVKSASREENVKAVLEKVELGEADAGIVYATDVKSAGAKATGVAIPAADNVIASYPIAVVKKAVHRDAARSFVRLVLSASGQRMLRRFGFLSPA